MNEGMNVCMYACMQCMYIIVYPITIIPIMNDPINIHPIKMPSEIPIKIPILSTGNPMKSTFSLEFVAM